MPFHKTPSPQSLEPMIRIELMTSPLPTELHRLTAHSHSRHRGASRPCAAPMSSTQTSPERPASPLESLDLSTSRLPKLPKQHTQPAQVQISSAQRIQFLVHREGFEPSYLARRSRFTVCRL